MPIVFVCQYHKLCIFSHRIQTSLKMLSFEMSKFIPALERSKIVLLSRLIKTNNLHWARFLFQRVVFLIWYYCPKIKKNSYAWHYYLAWSIAINYYCDNISMRTVSIGVNKAFMKYCMFILYNYIVLIMTWSFYFHWITT